MDPLIEAIRANPGDDAPRLVWADREGGERGEYVVLSLALGHRGLDQETRLRYSARLKELQAQHLDAWTGGLGKPGAHCTFSRGFLDHIHVDHIDRFLAHIDAIDAVTPLLSGVQFHEVATTTGWREAAEKIRVVLRRFGDRIHKLRFPARTPDNRYGDVAVAELLAPDAKMLVELDLMWSELTPAALPKLAELTKLRTLTIGHPALDGHAIIELLERMPKLTSLSLFWGVTKLTGEDVELLIAHPRMKEIWGEIHDCGLNYILRERMKNALGGRIRLVA